MVLLVSVLREFNNKTIQLILKDWTRLGGCRAFILSEAYEKTPALAEL